MILANLLHISYNMWRDWPAPAGCPFPECEIHFDPRLRCDQTVWRDTLAAMAAAGMNMVVLDLGDAVAYESCPELAVQGAWTPAKLREELAHCRALGLEPIPKLNFSACHDAWLGPWSRQLSTPAYYEVCARLISEVGRLFDRPRFFHLGMDEETAAHQRHYRYAVMRQRDLWWHDLAFFVREVEAAGSRAWIWSDVLWNCPRDTFAANVSRRVLQSNWYYATAFPAAEPPPAVAAFAWLDELGYEQVPTGSTWSSPDNMRLLVEHCRAKTAPERLLGFMMADWRPTTPRWRETHLEAVRVTAAAVQ